MAEWLRVACERAIVLDPACADAFQNRGNALVTLGRHAAALEDYARAQKLAPASTRPFWNESLCRLLMGDFGTAGRITPAVGKSASAANTNRSSRNLLGMALM